VVECKAGMLMVASAILLFLVGSIFLIELIRNLSVHSKELELGKDVLRYRITQILIKLWSNQDQKSS